MKLDIVKVKHDSAKGYRIINATDFDPERHELYGSEKTEQESVYDAVTRESMKAFLSDRGVNFPANIKTDKLIELYEAEAAKDAE